MLFVLLCKKINGRNKSIIDRVHFKFCAKRGKSGRGVCYLKEFLHG